VFEDEDLIQDLHYKKEFYLFSKLDPSIKFYRKIWFNNVEEYVQFIQNLNRRLGKTKTAGI
jgi:hypothetical protein